MNKNTKWYVVIAVSLIFLIVYAGYFFTDIGRGLGDDYMRTDESLANNEIDEDQKEDSNKLPIPPILKDKNSEKGKAEFDLKVQYGKKEFIEGYQTNTLGYNGDYLGPIIRVNKGDDVKINIENTLDEPTTVHWHGL